MHMLKTTDSIEHHLMTANHQQAVLNREHLTAWQVLCINVMSSPGAGKTALLQHTLQSLQPRYRMAVLEGDMTTQLDADRLATLNIPVVPITTGRCCHLDSRMVASGLTLLAEQVEPRDLDLLWVENVGNLVCPAEFEVGEHLKLAVLSVTEGDDKPLKYPVMFREADAVVISKIDLLPYLPVRLDVIRRHVRQINPRCAVFAVSALSGDGMDNWFAWVAAQEQALTAQRRPQPQLQATR